MRRASILALFVAALLTSGVALAITAFDGSVPASPTPFVLSDYWYRVWRMRVFGTDQTGKITTGQLQGWTQTDALITHADESDGSWSIAATAANSRDRTYHAGLSPFVGGSTQAIATARLYMTAALGVASTQAFFGFCDTQHWSQSYPSASGCNQYCGVYRNASGVLKWVGSDGGQGTISPLDAAGNTANLTLQATWPDNEPHDFSIVLNGDTTTMICSLYMDGVKKTTDGVDDVALDGLTATLPGVFFGSSTNGVKLNVMSIGYYQRRY